MISRVTHADTIRRLAELLTERVEEGLTAEADAYQIMVEIMTMVREGRIDEAAAYAEVMTERWEQPARSSH